MFAGRRCTLAPVPGVLVVHLPGSPRAVVALTAVKIHCICKSTGMALLLDAGGRASSRTLSQQVPLAGCAWRAFHGSSSLVGSRPALSSFCIAGQLGGRERNSALADRLLQILSSSACRNSKMWTLHRRTTRVYEPRPLFSHHSLDLPFFSPLGPPPAAPRFFWLTRHAYGLLRTVQF
jgi:hypothetical protein